MYLVTSFLQFHYTLSYIQHTIYGQVSNGTAVGEC